MCGVDVAYKGGLGAGAAVVLSYPGLEVQEIKVVFGRALIPYIPTYLAFREMPFLVRLVLKLEAKPSLFMINGHGVYHPAGLGLASHFGVSFDVPTIGVSGGMLKVEGQSEKGGSIFVGGKRVCCILGVRAGSRSEGHRGIYVSAGHRMSLDRAVEVTRSCFRDHSRPEPLFLADKITKKAIRSADVYG